MTKRKQQTGKLPVDGTLKIEYVPLADMQAWPGNPKERANMNSKPATAVPVRIRKAPPKHVIDPTGNLIINAPRKRKCKKRT